MKYVGSRKFKKINGINNLTVEVWSTSRGGTDSPVSYYLKYRGRWVSPLERRLRWKDGELSSWLMQIVLKEIYSGAILKDLVYSENPFLKMIVLKEEYSGSLYPIPIIYGI